MDSAKSLIVDQSHLVIVKWQASTSKDTLQISMWPDDIGALGIDLRRDFFIRDFHIQEYFILIF